eukprot:1555518-Lingulodinium_polyedra.AAC.1
MSPMRGDGKPMQQKPKQHHIAIKEYAQTPSTAQSCRPRPYKCTPGQQRAMAAPPSYTSRCTSDIYQAVLYR